MTSLKGRAERLLTRARAASPLLDRAWVSITHYVRAGGTRQAAAATYFGFLSFFPILALGFFVVGIVARVYPDAEADLVDAVGALFPGMIGEGDGQVPISVFADNAGTVGLVGLMGITYAGLGWLSGMRGALWVLFGVHPDERPSFLVGKGRDLLTLALLGVTLLVSVVVSSGVNGFSADLVELLGLDPAGTWPALVLWLVATTLAVGVTALLFMMMYAVLVRPDIDVRARWQGALLAAGLFEVLKWAAVTLIAFTADQPAFQAFGVALVVIVWINYFSRIAMLGAAWALAGDHLADVRADRAAEPGPPGAVP